MQSSVKFDQWETTRLNFAGKTGTARGSIRSTICVLSALALSVTIRTLNLRRRKEPNRWQPKIRFTNDCYDPEIPVNIVDLGLIYDVEINEDKVNVKMTLTAPGCGMGAMIASDAQQKILQIPGVSEAKVDLVWDPPWDASRISDEAKQKLGIG